MSEIELRVMPTRHYYSHAKIKIGIVDVHLIFDNQRNHKLVYVISALKGKNKPIELFRQFPELEVKNNV